MIDKENIAELIQRMKDRKKKVWSQPNPHIKPAWEATEIQSRIDKLEKMIKPGT